MWMIFVCLRSVPSVITSLRAFDLALLALQAETLRRSVRRSVRFDIKRRQRQLQRISLLKTKLATRVPRSTSHTLTLKGFLKCLVCGDACLVQTTHCCMCSLLYASRGQTHTDSQHWCGDGVAALSGCRGLGGRDRVPAHGQEDSRRLQPCQVARTDGDLHEGARALSLNRRLGGCFFLCSQRGEFPCFLVP